MGFIQEFTATFPFFCQLILFGLPPGSFSLLSSCLAPLVLMKVPKKVLFVACGACSCLGMASVAIFTHLKEGLQPNPGQWVLYYT